MSPKGPLYCHGNSKGFRLKPDHTIVIVEIDESKQWRDASRAIPLNELPKAIKDHGEKSEFDLVYRSLAEEAPDALRELERHIRSIASSPR